MARLYGVSYGNGNDGVSHMFAAFYVRTDDPFRLAELATIDTFKDGKGKEWARDHVEVDGEADYTISAVLYNPPDDDPGEDDDGDWCSVNGAWFICEVFPEEEPREGVPTYDSIEEAISATALALVPRKD